MKSVKITKTEEQLQAFIESKHKAEAIKTIAQENSKSEEYSMMIALVRDRIEKLQALEKEFENGYPVIITKGNEREYHFQDSKNKYSLRNTLESNFK